MIPVVPIYIYIIIYPDDYIISDSWIIAVAHVQASPKAHVQANPRPYRGGYISNIKHPYGSIYIYTLYIYIYSMVK